MTGGKERTLGLLQRFPGLPLVYVGVTSVLASNGGCGLRSDNRSG